jgi:hypothetical protein
MATALFGVPEGVPARAGVLRSARAAVRRRACHRSLVPDRAQVLRVVVTYRACPCGGWVAAITADGMRPRSVHTAQADEVAYVVQYELDVLMSETGRDLAPEHTVVAGPRPSFPPPV